MINIKLLSLIFILVVSFPIMNAMAQTAGKSSSMNAQEVAGNMFSEWKRKAMHDLTKIKKINQPKKAVKGLGPEIKLVKERIYFNGKELKLGTSLDSWRKIITGKLRCTEPEMSLCIWDELGLSIGVEEAGMHNVRYLNIQISLAEEDAELGKTPYPDGRPAKAPLDLSPHKIFPGYLELDGFRIDAETEFWDIRRNADPDRRLDCGLRDCSHPGGAFGDNAHIYMTLDGPSKRGKLREVSLDAVD